MTSLLKDHIVCTYARPAGDSKHLAIVEIAEPHELAGAEVMLTLRKSQFWIRELNEGDLVHVQDKLSPGDRIDFIADPCPNPRQPLFKKHYIEKIYQPEIPTSLVTAVTEPAVNSDMLRLDTFLSNPEDIAVFELLTEHCSKKEAGHLMLKYAIKNLPPVTKHMDSLQLYDWLNKF